MKKSAKAGRYLLSLPERSLRALTALAAGLLREGSEITLPPALRRTRLYQSLVEQTLRFLIEKVGRVEGTYGTDESLPEDFMVRRTAGNGIEWVSLAVFHASPVWVLAAMADLSGAGGKLMAEIAGTLEQEGWLTGAGSVRTMTDLLDALERGSGRLAETFNTPPLNREALTAEWEALKKTMTKPPEKARVEADWRLLQQTAQTQSKSLMDVSTAVALNTLRCGRRMLADPLLEHYGQTLRELNTMGFAAFAERELSPYWKAALANFSRP
ncbi:hypothetical protein [Bryobacter aggregatus]|uniref:hypothetical protein n=1 Tax=Bryobacter aggregatus TaxID=360054 RepID=UPI0004E1EAD2|nr:hypothetical protein [Bryobacter aggregatus]